MSLESIEKLSRKKLDTVIEKLRNVINVEELDNSTEYKQTLNITIDARILMHFYMTIILTSLIKGNKRSIDRLRNASKEELEEMHIDSFYYPEEPDLDTRIQEVASELWQNEIERDKEIEYFIRSLFDAILKDEVKINEVKEGE